MKQERLRKRKHDYSATRVGGMKHLDQYCASVPTSVRCRICPVMVLSWLCLLSQNSLMWRVFCICKLTYKSFVCKVIILLIPLIWIFLVLVLFHMSFWWCMCLVNILNFFVFCWFTLQLCMMVHVCYLSLVWSVH